MKHLSLCLLLLGGCLSWAYAQPGNDNCANATNININSCLTNQTTQNATVEAGEPNPCISAGGGCDPISSVWYRFCAGANDSVIRLSIDVTSVVGCRAGIAIYGPYTTVPTCMPTAGQAIHCEPLIYGENLGGSGANSAYYHDIRVVPGRCYMRQVLSRDPNGPSVGYINFDICLNRVCNHCGNTCGGLCWYNSSTAPSTTWIQTNCTPVSLNPAADSYSDLQHCFTFTAQNPTMYLTGIVTTTCPPGGNVTYLNWTLYNNSCGYITGPVDFFANNTITGLTVGQTYRICVRYEVAGGGCSISEFYLAVYGPLPVVLVSHGARCVGGQGEVSWVTAVEQDVQAFRVERSWDRAAWEAVAEVPPQGGAGLKSYRVADPVPVERLTYYRIVEVTTYGTEEVVALTALSPCGESAVRVTTETGQPALYFYTPVAGRFAFSLYTLSGQECLKDEVMLPAEGLSTYPLRMAPGVYLLVVQDPQGHLRSQRIRIE